MKKINLLLAFMIILSSHIMSQSYVQVIKGRVLDKITQMPLPGANILIPDTKPQLGTTTDAEGYFSLPNVKVGRVTLQVSYMGYHSQTVSNVLLHSGKELILNIELEERVVNVDEVVFVFQRDKTKPINKMTTVSARTFSIEESDKYAGSFGDVARMAANYAGVQGIDDSSNDIIIRGNSPNGLLWRLEGVDIPNPNHYGQFGATGGPVSMLNNNVLANSDFLTGAFPSEYGNALSGVFDLQMRNGNYDRHEFVIMTGMGGFEVGAEGPISKKNHSSYIINYRYSILSLVDKIIDLGTGTGVPEYQDLTFKFNLPTNKLGTFSIFGLGGISNIKFLASEDGEDDDSYYDWADFENNAINKNKVGVVGLNHKYLINETSYTRFNIAATFQENINATDSLSTIDGTPFNWYGQSFIDQKFNASFSYHKKINVKNNFKTGVRASQTNMRLSDSIYQGQWDRYEVTSDYKGTTYLIQSFIQWQFKPVDNLVFNAGINVPYITLNKEYVVEPRAGVKWNVRPKHAVSFAYGLHSKEPNTAVFFRQVELSNGDIITPNTDLGFTKSHHFVLGYDWNITTSTRLKLETYYQKIFDAVIDQSPSPYSSLNDGSFTSTMSDYVMNGGDGENIGLELTMERFLHKGLYYLFTTSLFDSKYKGSDGVERNTAFNSNYICNALIGKEWQFGKKNNKFFGINSKFVTAGGKLYTPIDIEESQLQGTTVYDDDRAFSERMDNFLRLDIQISFKSNSKKYTQEYALDIKNVTNYQNPFMMRYNVQSGGLVTIYQAGFSPMLTYRIVF